MVRYQQEFILTVKPDIQELLEQDWEEIEHNKDLCQLDPDWEAYDKLELAGALKVFTARDEETLVGYFVVVIIPSLHNKGVIQALADVIYLQRDYRKGFIGYKLFKFSERCLKEDGLKILYVSTTEVNPIDPLMSKLGYTKIETKYEKVL